jgi:hypothetical protein
MSFKSVFERNPICILDKRHRLFFLHIIRNSRKLPPLFGKYCQIRKLFQASSEKISALSLPLLVQFLNFISSKSSFFHKNIFFLIRKSLNSIFRANIRNLLLRAPTHGTYISTPLSMVF